MPVLDHVESRDPDIAGIGPRQGCEDPNRRGLAGSVGAEKGEDGAPVNLQVDAGENGVRAISLLESLDGDRQVVVHACPPNHVLTE